MDSTKQDFPVFRKTPQLVYADSSASSLKPNPVIESMIGFYETSGVNIHRGAYSLSEIATREYETARQEVADFLGADVDEVVFTAGTTAGINMIAHSLARQEWKSGDRVLVTEADHHSNWLIWQDLAKVYGVEFCVLPYPFREEDLEQLLTCRTKLFSFPYISNVLGTIFPVEKWIQKAQKAGVKTVVDAAQAVGHVEINFNKLGADFLVFSGHKMFGPTGIGGIIGKKQCLRELNPIFLGGGTVKEVTKREYILLETPHKWEPGTPNIAGAIGLGAAVKYIKKISIKRIEEKDQQLYKICLSKLRKFPWIRFVGPELDFDHQPILSFSVDGIHAHDIATILDMDDICVRAGHHCAKPLLRALHVTSLVRISLSSLYNDGGDIDRIEKALQHCKKIYS